jgi:hypothetical protein
MAKENKKTTKERSRSGSLLSSEAMGGINAGKGFDFQTRYAACNVPLWLIEAAFHQLFFEGTVMRGGDTDTNAAIAGALLGAAYGRNALPQQWVEKILTCRPKAGEVNVRQPRPECFWPVDAPDLARSLVAGGSL